MIEDSLLEDLVRRAGEALVVPADGPSRILAVRDATTPRRARGPQPVGSSVRQVRAAAWVRRRPILASAAALTLIACAAVPVAASLRESAGPVSMHAAVGSAPLKTPGALSTGSSTAAAGIQEIGPATPKRGALSPDEVPTLPSKVIKTGAVSLQVGQGKLGDTLERLTSLATSFGGFVASSSSSTVDADSPPSGDITLRVPVASFESLLIQVQILGKPTSVTTSGQDVTSQYVDLQARIQSLADTRSQFQLILTKAESIGDILAVEQQINDIQTQIEQLQGQLEVMTDQTSYSTLSVQVAEQARKTAAASPRRGPSGVSKAWNHAEHSFTRGVEAVIAASGGIAVFALFLGILVGLTRFAWILLRRRLV
jgi:uncharacterized protein DUF4349